jgi:type I restriction enzyme S subunit
MSSNLMKISVDSTLADPYFVYLSIVCSESVKNQIRQSVNSGGRDVANSEVMSQLRFAWPSINEQLRISRIGQSHGAITDAGQSCLVNLQKLKAGLMQDLLSGRVRVKADESEEAAAHA